MKIKIKWIVLIIASICVVPFILQFFVFNNSFPSKVSNDGWAGFFGAYIGAIIGSIATIVAVKLGISNNEKVRKEDLQREFRPYLYFIPSTAREATMYNLGKYAACDIKGYIVVGEKKTLAWNQHFCLDGNSNYEIIMKYLSNPEDYYIYEFKDLLGNNYSQIVRYTDNGVRDDFYSEEPQLIR